MAKLIKKTCGDVTFACYSERGIISHLMFRVLPKAIDEFLNRLSFPALVPTQDNPLGRAPNPFAGATRNDLSEIVLFSEMDFGTVGFGKPDGAVSFCYKGTNHFIFIEGKANETYETSCKVRKRRSKAPLTATNEPTNAIPTEERQSANGYNSTIRGQLELRYCMVRLFKEHPGQAFEPLLADEEPDLEALQEGEDEGQEAQPDVDGRRTRCLREIDSVKTFYRDKDGFYAHPNRADPQKLGSWRRLWLREGVEQVFAYLANTEQNNIHFLTFTNETANPFDTLPADLRPRFFDSTWEACRDRFPWISSQDVENIWNGM